MTKSCGYRYISLKHLCHYRPFKGAILPNVGVDARFAPLLDRGIEEAEANQSGQMLLHYAKLVLNDALGDYLYVDANPDLDPSADTEPYSGQSERHVTLRGSYEGRKCACKRYILKQLNPQRVEDLLQVYTDPYADPYSDTTL